MDLLKRKLAPLTSEAWDQIDEEARRVLTLNLAGRKIVDFSGPHGWTLGAVNTRRRRPIDPLVPGVEHELRIVQPLVELRASFTLPILELDQAARGAHDLDLDAVVATAERVARDEDTAIFHGYKEAQIRGIIEASPHTPVDVKAPLDWPRAVVSAYETLRISGISGPYVLALGIEAYDELNIVSEMGYPIRHRLEETLPDLSFVRAAAIQGGGVLVSKRGGDYELSVGQDLSIGYTAHDRKDVELYITESFTFRVLEDKAAVYLRRTPPPAK